MMTMTGLRVRQPYELVERYDFGYLDGNRLLNVEEHDSAFLTIIGHEAVARWASVEPIRMA